MARVYLSIGSNIERQKHICSALDALSNEFEKLTLSSIYESESVGFQGEHFFNLAAGIDTGASVGELLTVLRRIEYDNGRRRGEPKFSSRTLDIDILTYDDIVGTVDDVVLPRSELIKNAFVLQPMAELAPQELHPALNISYADLWASYSNTSQKLWIVDFYWRNSLISQRAEAV